MLFEDMRPQAKCSNHLQSGTRQMLMQWNNETNYYGLKSYRKCWKIIIIIVFRTLNLVVQNGISLPNRTSKMSFPLITLTSTKSQTKWSFWATTFCHVTSCKQTLACLEEFCVKIKIVWTLVSLFEHWFWSIWQWLQTAMDIGIYPRMFPWPAIKWASSWQNQQTHLKCLWNASYLHS